MLRREAGDSNDPSVRTWVRERWVYHQSGDGEDAFGTGPAGDDAPAARFIDAEGDGTFETVQHFICNRRGDVVAVVGPGIDGEPNDGRTAATIPGEVIARIWYDDYAYVLNQPGRYVDPLGLRWAASGKNEPPRESPADCDRNKRWVEQPWLITSYVEGFFRNLGNWGEAASVDAPAGPVPAAPRKAGPNQGVNPIDEAMHAIDVADRTGRPNLATLSTNRFTELGFRDATDKLAQGMTIAEIAISMASEPVDLLLSVEQVVDNPKDWMAWSAMLPFVPAAVRFMPSGGVVHVTEQVLDKAYDSGILKGNLQKFGIKTPSGCQAHHIIGDSKLAGR